MKTVRPHPRPSESQSPLQDSSGDLEAHLSLKSTMENKIDLRPRRAILGSCSMTAALDPTEQCPDSRSKWLNIQCIVPLI